MLQLNEKTRIAMVLGAVSMLTLVMTASSFTAAFAANPHFVGQPRCTVSTNGAQGSLTCSGKIAGLGNAEFVTATTTATVQSACVNKGGNFPTGQQGSTASSGPQQFQVDRNGQISYQQTVSATSTAKCNGQGLQLCFVFTNVFVTIEGQQLQIPGTFSNCRI
jgi:hypothetical protein